jgi:hypothetical protein
VTNKTYLKDWIINEFPMLFYGFHNWFQMKIKNRKEVTFSNNPNSVNDLSNFMNSLLTWYIVQVLPPCYSSHLSSESGSILEKLKNCIIVIFIYVFIDFFLEILNSQIESHYLIITLIV